MPQMGQVLEVNLNHHPPKPYSQKAWSLETEDIMGVKKSRN